MAHLPFIQFQNITKKFGDKIVLNSVNLEIGYGERFGIIGVSGSGKTTLLNLLIGFLNPTSGHIFYQSHDIVRDKQNIRKTFGFATQDGSFYTKLSVKENLNYFGKMYGMAQVDINRRSEGLLKLVGLYQSKDVIAENLSKGMQRRLDIACALIHDPKVLILDEPTEDLDPMLRKDILLLIKKINERGTTIVITSHLLTEIEAICTKIAILHNGKIIETGTPDHLKGRYYKNEEIHLQSSPGNYEKLAHRLRKIDIDSIDIKEHKMIVYTPKAERVLHRILHVIEQSREHLVDVSVNKPTLEEVFERLTKR
ncbi:MAG: ABC transporter ATP-binding protein [Candidatus Nanoarchaeia archaeon]